MPRRSSPVLDNPRPEIESHCGELVQYYLGGERAGYLEKVSRNGEDAVIRPIATYKSGTPRNVTVPVKYVSVVEIKAAPVKA